MLRLLLGCLCAVLLPSLNNAVAPIDTADPRVTPNNAYLRTEVNQTSAVVLGVEGDQSYIVGGTQAIYGEFPYMVIIKFAGNMRCGGALITQSHVLTASHCISKYTPTGGLPVSLVTVTVGSNLLSGAGGITRRVQWVMPHPQFSENGLVNDIGIMKLSQPVPISRLINVAPVSSAQDVPAGATLVMPGFGTSRVGDPISAHDVPSSFLKKTTVVVVSRNACQSYWTPFIRVHEGVICTDTTSGTGTCVGDSGGPMLYNGKIVGVVSYGYKECAVGYPDVATNVGQYYNFIQSVIKY